MLRGTGEHLPVGMPGLEAHIIREVKEFGMGTQVAAWSHWIRKRGMLGKVVGRGL